MDQEEKHFKAVLSLLRQSRKLPDGSTGLVTVCKKLLHTLQQHPQLDQALCGARFADWLLKNGVVSSRQKAEGMFHKQMLTLLWSFSMCCTLSEALLLCHATSALQKFTSPENWMTIRKSQPAPDPKYCVCQDDTFLWEALIRHQRWDTLAWVFSPAKSTDMEHYSLMLLQLLSAKAPASAFRAVLGKSSSDQMASTSRCEWPRITVTGQLHAPVLDLLSENSDSASMPPQMLEVMYGRHARLPDPLTLAVELRRGDVVNELLPFTRWGGAMVDSSKTDKACPLTVQDLVRLARAAGSNKSYFQAWELPHGYRIGAIWQAVVNKDMQTLKVLLDHLDSAGKREGDRLQHHLGQDAASKYVWVPDTALHLEGLFQGTSALYEAVRSNQHQAVKLLLQAGAHPLRACFAGGAAAEGHGSGTPTISLLSGGSSSSSSSTRRAPGWTTPLHVAVKRGDTGILRVLLSRSQHSLPTQQQQGFGHICLPTDYCRTGAGSVHELFQDVPVTVLDSQGQTPLSLALSSNKPSAAAAALLLVKAGVPLLQLVKDPSSSKSKGCTHALLMAAKACMAGSNPSMEGFAATALAAGGSSSSSLSATAGSTTSSSSRGTIRPTASIDWSSATLMSDMFHDSLSPQDAVALASWLSQQPQVITVFEAMDLRTMVQHMLQVPTRPAAGHMLLSPPIQRIYISKQRQQQPDVSSKRPPDVFELLLKQALQRGSVEAITVLLERVDFVPGSLSDISTVKPDTVACVAAHMAKLLDMGLSPDCKGTDGTPLSQLLLPLGMSALQPLLDTGCLAVVADTDSAGNNLLHAAAQLPDFKQRQEAVAAVAQTAAAKGWTAAFAARNAQKKLPAALCKHVKIKKRITDGEAQAKKTAAAAAAATDVEKPAAQASKAAAAAAAGSAAQQQKAVAAAADADPTAAPTATSASAAAAEAPIGAQQAAQEDAAAAAKHDPPMPVLEGSITSASGPPTSKADDAHASPPSPAADTLQPLRPAALVETEKQTRSRLLQLMSQIPGALQAAACPATEITEAVAAAVVVAGAETARAQQLTAAGRIARDEAVAKQQLQVLSEPSGRDGTHCQNPAVGAAPDGQGPKGQPAAAAADGSSGGRQHATATESAAAAAATAAAGGLALTAAHLDGRGDDGDMSSSSVCRQSSASPPGSGLPALVPDVDEMCLSGLPWEFTITREALMAWMRLDRDLAKVFAAHLRHIGHGSWQDDGSSERLPTTELELELWSTKVAGGGCIIWQVAVDFSEARHCWCDMIRVWALHTTRDRQEYTRQLNSTLATITASHRRSLQVQQRLKLQPVVVHTRAGGSSSSENNQQKGSQPPEATCSSPEERLPRQYRRVPSADEGGDDDNATAAAAGTWLTAVAVAAPTSASAGAVHPATEAGVAAAQEPCTPPEQQQQQQQGGKAGAPGDWGDGQKERHLVEHLPPANGTEDVYTLLKLYTVSSQLVRAVLQGRREDEVEFPFRVSEQELDIIENVPRPPASMLLLGRSGTGKTTVLVFRMFLRWWENYRDSERHLKAVFVTASKTLKEQVASTFRRLQAAAIVSPADAAAVKAARVDARSLINLPPAAFPLFMTTRDWLKALDASCSESFFVRTPDGRLAGREIEDWDGIGLEVDLGEPDWLEDDGSDCESEGFDAQPEVNAANWDDRWQQEQQPPAAGPVAEQGRRQRRRAGAAAPPDAAAPQDQHATVKHLLGHEVTYAEFVSCNMWEGVIKGVCVSKQEVSLLKAPLVYAEIMSYIKGSAEALEAGGHLSEAQYLEVVGRKRAPNFTSEQRPLVYRAWQQYEWAKASRRGWDRADLAAHLYRQLAGGGYRGALFEGIYRDEVQDFTQAELCLDLRVCSDPNGLFYCGDTCQTIARGIGFRFEDVRVLMYQEGLRRRDAGAAGPAVGQPVMRMLTTNYRTHAGILDAAASITSVLSYCFPHLLDKLPRERAFFPGPQPLLLGGLDSMDDMSILLSSDPGQSEVEWGAHQVILVRDLDARARLPKELQHSNALIMTVAQSKGLEFDDVFLVDFFSDSPVSAGWRVLLHLLAEYEEVVESVARYAAALHADRTNNSGGSTVVRTWQELATTLTAGQMRQLVSKAAGGKARRSSPGTQRLANAAVAAADRSVLLKTLPTSAHLSEVQSSSGDVGEQPGWLRPLDFDVQQHSLLCEELKHLYVGLTRAKNFCVLFDRDGAARAPLYHFLRRLSLGSHVSSVLGGGLAGSVHGSLSNNPLEWSKRAANLVEMKLFKLAAQCFGSAGDVLRAAAYGAVEVLHEYYSSTQQPSSTAGGSSSKKTSLLATADVLLTCAVQGGNMAGNTSASGSAAATAPIQAAAERCGLAVPLIAVPGAVAAPITSEEAMKWLGLAARAFDAVGYKIEAGRLLLGMGPAAGGGNFLRLARKLLLEGCRGDEAARVMVAGMFEEAAQRELSQEGSCSARDPSSAGQRAEAGAAVPASRLLHDAFQLHLKSKRFDECKRLLQQYPYLQRTLRPKQVDDVELAWIRTSAQHVGRDVLLAAINKLAQLNIREELLEQHGFWKELAASLKDTSKAAQLLARHGDFEAAAQRCLCDPSYINRATFGQLQQLHSWLLRVSTVDTARQAVLLWDSQVVQGRSYDGSASSHAAAQLALARALLRQAVGVAAPSVAGNRVQAASNPAVSSGRPKQQSRSSSAVAEVPGSKARQPPVLTAGRLGQLHERLSQQSGAESITGLVAEAVVALADAKEAFVNAQEPAGTLEALAWALAAKSLEDITVGNWQLKKAGSSGGSRLCDVLDVVCHTQQAVVLLQGLSHSVSSTEGRSGTHEQQLPQQKVTELLRSLERFYGVQPLAGNDWRKPAPVALRSDCVMFTEALAALSKDPSSLLLPTQGDTAYVSFHDAVCAIAVHLYGLVTDLLGRCMSAAAKHLQQHQWLHMQLRRAASSSSSTVQVVDMDTTRDVLKQSLDVVLGALAANVRLQEVASVVKACKPLSARASHCNTAAKQASQLAQQLASLLVSLEFPPYDPGCGSEEYSRAWGAAAAMPVTQASIRQLLKQEPFFDLSTKARVQQARAAASTATASTMLHQLLACDPAAAFWALRTSCYSHEVANSRGSKQAQTTIDHLVDALGLQWQKEAAILADDPQAYQLLLEAEVRGAPAYQSAAGATADRPCLDAELLLRARSCMSAQQPAMACEALLLLLERSLMKEQLAAGLLHQEGGSTAKADDSIWARVRPMPPDIYVQLLETIMAVATLGLSTTVAGAPQLLLTEPALSALYDPVLLPPGHPGLLLQMWLELDGGNSLTRKLGAMFGMQPKAQVKGAAEQLLLRVLRVCTNLATTNWRIWGQQPVAVQQGQSDTSSGGTDQLPVPLVFSEWLVAVADSNFTAAVLHPDRRQAKARVQQQSDQGTGCAATGAATAVLMPLLAARLALLLCCLVADLAVLQSSQAAGSKTGTGQQGQTHNLLVLSLTAARQLLQLGADLATTQHNQQPAAGGVQQHWLVLALGPLQTAVDALLPAGSAKGSSNTSMQIARFADAALSLAGPLGVKLLQISTEPGEGGGTDREFTGLSSKYKGSQPVKDKALASIMITTSNVHCDHLQVGSTGMPTALQLPKLSEVHLDLRISPAELRARAESAAKVAQLQERWRQRRFHRLVGDPSIQAALKKCLQRARQRIQQRREQEDAARAAELAAVQATIHQSSCSRVYAEQRAMFRQASLTPPLWSDTAVAWGCSTQQQQAASELHTLWLHTEVCFWGSTKLLQLQAIQRLLQERGAAGTLGQSCPVCRVAQLWADDWAYRQQQQEQAMQAQARQQQECQQGLAGTSATAGAGGARTVLSVNAAEFLPHAQQHTHRQSAEMFQAYVDHVTGPARILLFEAAKTEYEAAVVLQSRAFEEVQALAIRSEVLVRAAHGLFECMEWVAAGQHWTSGATELAPHEAHLAAALADLRAEVGKHQQYMQAQQHHMQQGRDVFLQHSPAHQPHAMSSAQQGYVSGLPTPAVQFMQGQTQPVPMPSGLPAASVQAHGGPQQANMQWFPQHPGPNSHAQQQPWVPGVSQQQGQQVFGGPQSASSSMPPSSSAYNHLHPVPMPQQQWQQQGAVPVWYGAVAAAEPARPLGQQGTLGLAAGSSTGMGLFGGHHSTGPEGQPVQQVAGMAAGPAAAATGGFGAGAEDWWGDDDLADMRLTEHDFVLQGGRGWGRQRSGSNRAGKPRRQGYQDAAAGDIRGWQGGDAGGHNGRGGARGRGRPGAGSSGSGRASGKHSGRPGQAR